MTRNLEEEEFRVKRWNSIGDYRSVIELLGALPLDGLSYDLTLCLAEAYNGCAEFEDSETEELYSQAERLLFATEEDGLSDNEWCNQMATCLLGQGRDSEALQYAERATELAPEDIDARKLRESCALSIESKTIVRPVNASRIASLYDEQG